MTHHLFRSTGILTPTTEETVYLRGYTLAAVGLCLTNALTKTA